MVRKLLSQWSLSLLCLLTVSASLQPPVFGGDPKTVSITFALVIPVDPFSPDFNGNLSDYLGEQTQKIQFGARSEVSDTLRFTSNSPNCGEIVVADTSWSLSHQTVKIVNQGQDVWASVYCPGSVFPADRANLDADRITSVNACWTRLDPGSGQYVAQPVADLNTSMAFFIVTATFRK